MSHQVLLQILTILGLISTLQAEFFDLSNGNSAGLIFPCGAPGVTGLWKFEEASKYPGGPTEGTVFTSDPTKGSCVLVQNLVTLSQDTKFNFKAFVPYTSSLEVMYVWLVTEDQFANYEWVKITGPITAGSEWIERSISLPAGIKNGNYYVEVWDTSTRHAISLRYFDITDQAITTAFPVFTDTTPESSTTEPSVTTYPPIVTCPPATTCPPIVTCPPATTCPPIVTCPPVTTCPPIATCPPIVTCPPATTCPPCNCYCNSPCCSNENCLKL